MRYFLLFVFMVAASLHIVGCHAKKSDYTVSMKQCGRIIARMNEYKNKYGNIPNEPQLIDFMNQKGDDPKTIGGWNFHQEDIKNLAFKKFVTMDSGRIVDITITKESEFLIVDSTK